MPLATYCCSTRLFRFKGAVETRLGYFVFATLQKVQRSRRPSPDAEDVSASSSLVCGLKTNKQAVSYLCVVLVCISLVTSDIKYAVMYLFTIYMSSLMKCLFQKNKQTNKPFNRNSGISDVSIGGTRLGELPSCTSE